VKKAVRDTNFFIQKRQFDAQSQLNNKNMLDGSHQINLLLPIYRTKGSRVVQSKSDSTIEFVMKN